MSYPSAPSRVYQIDVVDQVSRAYRAVIDNAQLVGEMALLPYLIVLGIQLAGLLISGGGTFARAMAGLIDAIGVLLFGTVFIVRWHRFILRGEAVGGGLIPPGWTPFLFAGVKLGVAVFVGWLILMVVAALPPHFLTAPLAMIGGLALSLAALRVSLIFPAAAIERPIGLRTAWDWLTGNFWRLFISALACCIPFAIVEVVIAWLAGIFPSLTWIVFAAAQLALSFTNAAVMAALLSHIYRDIETIIEPA
jgi:hypothetical protein